MKLILNKRALFSGLAAGLVAVSTVSCRNVSNEAQSLTCAASSGRTIQGAEMAVLDPALGGNQLAQSFKPQATVKNVGSVALALQAVASSTTVFGNSVLRVAVVADRAGTPDLTQPLTSTVTVAANTVLTYPQAVEFKFSRPIAELTANTTYWIVLDANYSWSASAHISWLGTDLNSYADGQALAYNRGLWTSPDGSGPNNRDLAFQIGCL